jgi:hypothetical protein
MSNENLTDWEYTTLAVAEIVPSKKNNSRLFITQNAFRGHRDGVPFSGMLFIVNFIIAYQFVNNKYLIVSMFSFVLFLFKPSTGVVQEEFVSVDR